MKPLVSISLFILLALASGCKTSRSADCNGAKTHGWEAWNNLMPGADKTVHVVGKATTTSGGWKAVIAKRTPQGINPEILLLDLTITPPTGPTTQPVLDLDLRYSEKYTSGKYTRAQVFCGKEFIADLQVKDTH